MVAGVWPWVVPPPRPIMGFEPRSLKVQLREGYWLVVVTAAGCF